MINVLDIETFEENEHLIPYCLSLSINDEKIVFYYDENDEIMMKNAILYMLKNITNEDNVIFIHNLNFDGLILIHYFTKNKLNFKIKALRGEIYWLELYHMRNKLIFRCSYKIIPLSLKKIGEIEKIFKPDFPHIAIKRNNVNSIIEIDNKEFDIKKKTVAYCLNDIDILKNCLKNLLKTIKSIDNLVIDKCFSAASMSHFIFFKHFNKKKINKKIKIHLDEYCRKAYKGGRCEVFGNVREGEVIKYFDFPGMYGLCMREKFHNGKEKFTTKADISQPGFHTVTYKSNSNIPVLPSHSISGKLLFRNGIFTDTVWFEELMHFVKNGGEILEKHHSLIFDKYEEVFEDFINYFTEMREKEGYYKIFGKLMINSLYGSMALKNEEIFSYITFSETEFLYISETLNVEKFYKINDVFVILIKIDYKFKNFYKGENGIEVSNRNVSYSAAITSKARIKLHEFFLEVERDGGRILYCDTDSVFAAYDKNNLSLELNGKKWMSIYKDGVFAAPKSYALKKYNNEEIIKIKGISFKEINFDEFKEKFYQEKEIDFSYQKIQTKKSFILNQKNTSKKINFGKYDKRIFSNDKKSTFPLNTDIQRKP